MSMGNSSEVIEEIDDDSKISARESMEGSKDDDCMEYLALHSTATQAPSPCLLRTWYLRTSLTRVLVEDKLGPRRHLVHQYGQGELVRLFQECQEL
jgi:hypothetical protein